MKKIYSLALVLALLLSLSTPALADTTLKDPDESASIPVTGYYYSGTSNDVVYSVDISWSNMSFSYDGGDKTWNPNTHDYTGSNGEGHWRDSNATITVENHSNAFLTLQCTYTANQEYISAYLNFTYPLCAPDTTSGFVYSAEVEGKEHTATISVTPDGALPENTPAGTAIGNITVTIGNWTGPTVNEADTTASEWVTILAPFENEFSENTLYTNTKTAVERLSNSIINAKASGNRTDHVAMLDAYLDAYAAMANFNNQYPDTPVSE